MAVIERRSRQERRSRDMGPPPDCSERRYVAERRLPKVVEKNISDAEWRTYFGQTERRGV